MMFHSFDKIQQGIDFFRSPTGQIDFLLIFYSQKIIGTKLRREDGAEFFARYITEEAAIVFLISFRYNVTIYSKRKMCEGVRYVWKYKKYDLGLPGEADSFFCPAFDGS